MPVRTNRGGKLIRRARERRANLELSRARRAAAPAEADATERRDLDPEQDVAVYNCSCGLVFEAPVVTSVGCPHCGSSQAW